MSPASSPILERLERELDRRKEHGLFRELPQATAAQLLDLSGNSYLSFHRDPQIAERARELQADLAGGNLASRLVSVRSNLYGQIEQELAQWKQCESALLFSSGYCANVGIIQALCTRDTTVFCDRLNHASIYDGIALSGARLVRYAHCDMADLQARLAACDAKAKIIVTDSVFSMDGDIAPLADIAQLGKESGALVMVDEAHATGVLGKGAGGAVEMLNVGSGVQVRMGTLSKALAGLGGFFAGSTFLKECFVNLSRSFIYSTALPQSVLAWNLAAIQSVRARPQGGERLLERSAHFRQRLNCAGCVTCGSSTQIVPVVTGSAQRALGLAAYLRNEGIAVAAIRPPTVPQGSSRIRLSLCSEALNHDLDRVADRIIAWLEANGGVTQNGVP